MRLLEDDLKPILKDHGVVVPAGGPYSPAIVTELGRNGSPLVVKVLSPHNDRHGRGEIEIVPAAEAEAAAARLAGAGPLWVEQAVEHEGEYFLGVVWPGERDAPRALFSDRGGSGVVDRSGAMWSVEVTAGADRKDLAASLVREHRALAPTAEALLAVFDQLDALSLELNPVVLDPSGTPCVLDAKSYLDPYGRGPERLGRAERPERTDGVSVEYVALEGRVGVVSIGAGLTRAVIDWLDEAGPGAACFTDLIGPVLADASLLLAGSRGPTCVAATRWIADRLAARGVDTLLVCLVSGGTPTDALSRSVLEGVGDWGGRIVAFVAGNRSDAARDLWTAAGLPSPRTLAETIAACAAPAAVVR